MGYKTQDEYLQPVTVNFTNMFKGATAFNTIYNNLPQQTDYVDGETPLTTFLESQQEIQLMIIILN